VGRGLLTPRRTLLVAEFGPARAEQRLGWKLAAIINAAVGIPIGLAPFGDALHPRSKTDTAEWLMRDGRGRAR